MKDYFADLFPRGKSLTEEDLKTKIRTLIKDSFVSINIRALDDFERVFLQHYVENYHTIIQKIYALVNFPNFKVGWTYKDSNDCEIVIFKKFERYMKTANIDTGETKRYFLDGNIERTSLFGDETPGKYQLIYSTGKKWEPEE